MKKRAIAAIAAIVVMLLIPGCVKTPARADGTATESMPTATVEAAMTPSAAMTTPLAGATPTPQLSPSGTPAATDAAATPTPAPAAASKPLTVTECTLAYSNEHVSVNIIYPEISGMADAAAQSGINEQVEVCFQDMANVLEEKSESDDAYGPHGTYFIETDYEVKRNDGGVLSIHVSISEYEGGANTASDAVFINVINSNPAQQPTLSELFSEDTDYETVLGDKINALIAASPDAEEYSFSGVNDDDWYYLTDTSLVIVFPRYSIIAGAYGEPEFSIPLSSLSGVLIPGIA